MVLYNYMDPFENIDIQLDIAGDMDEAVRTPEKCHDCPALCRLKHKIVDAYNHKQIITGYALRSDYNPTVLDHFNDVLGLDLGNSDIPADIAIAYGHAIEYLDSEIADLKEQMAKLISTCDGVLTMAEARAGGRLTVFLCTSPQVYEAETDEAGGTPEHYVVHIRRQQID